MHEKYYLPIAASESSSQTSFEETYLHPKTSKAAYIDLAFRIASSLLFVCGLLMILFSRRHSTPSDQECAAQLSVWSPAFQALEFQQRDFVETRPPAPPSEYMGPPTPDLEEKWEELENLPAISIPPSHLPSLNRSASQNFLRTQPPDPEGYIGTIQVFHYLHCLNKIRQYIHRDSYTPKTKPSFLAHHSARDHVGHCIETLRQALMCQPDLTPYLWYDEHPGPAKEDFEASHRCVKFERIVEWTRGNGVKIPREAFRGEG